MTVGIGNMLTTGIKATNFSLPTCPLREEKSLSQRAFSIYTDIRKLRDKAKTSLTILHIVNLTVEKVTIS